MTDTAPLRDTWRRVCLRRDLRPGVLQQVSLGRDPLGIPLSVLVGVSQAGELYAYQNLCKHLPIPLDGGSGDFFAGDVDTLRCGTHGALYRVSDGFCTRGPCRGTFLRRHLVRELADEVWVKTD
ncbi:MAG: Rieske 2Fe-2S domain-containing protein [Sandaracinaceae bacterium]|nr:Rieske 2Fe-2S domain-containing protein [Sandaracinaceae bacterium]MBP7680833.1 Rieske 2Fe-2S domain-containing protein [Deltaproteobacteria bacterium]MBK7153667.1 Rieske 2Fe-2S domain-containing protein [Sandaracinaceae bacterium]MBK7775168.1 Rieske 2Fe-2S domain-containing protein [Sandaracinaceae bacterium]MBK8408366.1 Rieske 2Fe-2S domain-containing protein [Sandaracinaceae bacterium]